MTLLLIIQILIFASLILSAYMMVVTLERCRSEKRYAFVYCIVTIFLYTLGYFIEITCGNTGGAVVAIKIMYAGGSFMSPLFFFFVADYCEIRVPKKYYRIPLLIVPVLLYVMVATFDHHQLLYRSYFYNPEKAIQSMSIEPGTLYMVNTYYPLFCIVLSCIALIRSIVRQSRGRRFSLVLLLISALAPLIAQFVYIGVSFFFQTALAGINFTAFVMVISNFIFFYNVIRNDMFDLAPKAHAITMDLIRDAFVVLDRDMAYMGSNKKAAELFPALIELHKGAYIKGMENWPSELMNEENINAQGTDLRKEIEFTLPQRPGRTYSGWENRVTSESGATLGWVILIQDITEMVSLIRNIQAQHDEIAAMRDNLKEGLFLMDREFRIQPSYSRALEEVLSGENFQGKRFTDLLVNSYRKKDLETIADYFTMIMDKSVDADMLEDINPLSEFSYNSVETGKQKTLRCIFAPVDQQGGDVFVMGTIQDISAETALKKQLAEEEARRQNEMRSLFEVMQVDQKVFGNFIEDADYEFNRVNQMLKDKKNTNRQMLINLYQSIHAIKSNSVIVGLSSYGEKLHELESKIKELRDSEEEPQFDSMLHIVLELEKCMQEKDKLTDIVRRLKDFNAAGNNSGDNAGVKTVTDDEAFTETLKQACEKVAADEHKNVSFVVEAFDRKILQNPDLRRAVKDILTQMVRNAVYHGIEKPEERLARGKDATGKITLSVNAEGEALNVILADDGQGLDFTRIAQKAEEKGLIKNPADRNNIQFLTNIIFSPGFSTSETENMHAGRGIGLNLVRDRLKEIKGTMRIRNNKGMGLSYVMQIPLPA